MSSKPFRRIVLTGAAGRLGHLLRKPLAALTETLVLSDRASLREPAGTGEIFIPCDLSDRDAMFRLLAGAEAAIHMGGVSQERPFGEILPANLVGQFNLYDAALAQGVQKIVLASSNHVTGFYKVGEKIDARMPMRPDSLYGVSKGYGELLARFYHDRHAIQSVCLRIGSCSPVPRNLRSLSSWLSHDDFVALVCCALCAPAPGFAVVYGVSDNPEKWWEDDDADRIGYRPRDSSEQYRLALAAAEQDEQAPSLEHQGGNAAIRDYRDPETLVDLRILR